MLTHLCHTAQVEGVKLLLAPVMGAETPLIAEAPVLNTARQLSQMLAWVDPRQLGVCLDTNVMSANGDTVADWLSLFPGRIGLVDCATATGTAGGRGATAFCRWTATSAS